MPITRAYSWNCGETMIPASDQTGGSLNVEDDPVKTGAYCLRYAHDEVDEVVFPLAGSPTNPSVSVYVLRRSSAYEDVDYSGCLSFLLTSGHYIDLLWNLDTRTYDLYIDTALVASGTIVVPQQDWFHVQMYATIANAGGTVQVKIDGHLSIDYTGDTQPGATDTVTHFVFGGGHDDYGGGGGTTVYLDDLIIGNGGFLGDSRCVDLRPNADTAQDDWTPSSGDNYSTIDETPASDADYNESSVDGDADELDLTAFDGATYDPQAVTAWVRAQQTAALGDSIHVGVDSGGTDGQSAAQALATTWVYYFHTLTTNPNGGGAWDDAALDALKLRYESVIT